MIRWDFVRRRRTLLTALLGVCRPYSPESPLQLGTPLARLADTGISTCSYSFPPTTQQTRSVIPILQALTMGSAHRHDLGPDLRFNWKTSVTSGPSTTGLTVLLGRGISICIIQTAVWAALPDTLLSMAFGGISFRPFVQI